MRADLWPPDKIARLKGLLGTMSASKIGKEFDMSKSAILGQVRRQGWHKPKRKPKLKPKPQIAKRGRDLIDLGPRDCRYPYGHPGEAHFSFCGKPVLPGRSWCHEHFELCTAKLPKLVEAAL